MSGIVDVHSHPLLPRYVALYGGASADGVTLPPWSVEQHLATMDAHGIERAVLSLPNIPDLLRGPEGARIARQLNDDLAAVVAGHPDRFAAFAAVVMDDIDAARSESARALDELGMAGICASPQVGGSYLGDPRYDPWLAELSDRGAVLFVHPGRPDTFDVEANRLNVAVLEFMFETTRMVTSMVLSGAKRRFSGVDVIAAHGGGTIPYLASRIASVSVAPWAYRGSAGLTPQEVLEDLASFHYDLTAATSAAQLQAITALLAAENLLLGFDFPMMPVASIAPAIAAFEHFAGFDDAQRAAIRRGNALRLMPALGDQAAEGK